MTTGHRRPRCSTTPTTTRSTKTPIPPTPACGTRRPSTATTNSTSGPCRATRTSSPPSANPAQLSNRFGVSLDPAAYGPDAHRAMSFLAMDPPDHTRMRSLVSKAFTPRRVAELEDGVRKLAVEHVDAAVERDTFDFVADFAGLLPMDVISEMIGVPRSDRAELRRLADLLMHRVEGFNDVPPEGVEAALAMAGYFDDMVRDRRARPAGGPHLGPCLGRSRRGPAHRRRDHLVSLPHGGGRQRDHHQAPGQRLVLGLAVPRRTGQGLRRPEPDPRLGGGDPALRHLVADAPAGHDRRRRAPRDGPRPTANGSCSWSARPTAIPVVFVDPDRYDLDRDTSKLVSFGSGRHFCLGAALARLEGRVGLQELLKRIDDYDIDPAGVERVHSINVRGFARLPTTVSVH